MLELNQQIASGRKRYSRFSPVWLYRCICKALGLTKRLSHTRHLCVFCVPDDFFELNWLIIDLGPRETPLATRLDSFGGARDAAAKSMFTC
jgi:hypothetical protein